jgi:hypothetical protein
MGTKSEKGRGYDGVGGGRGMGTAGKERKEVETTDA